MTPSELIKRLKHVIHSTTGKNALVFLVFLCISTVFWFMLALNDEIQREFDIPVELSGVPDSVTLITTPPQSLNVSVKQKGGSLLRFQLGGIPAIKLRYKDFSNHDGRLVMGESQITGAVRSYFGAGTVVTVAKPDSIALAYTTRPGRLLPLKLNVEADVDPRYVINGPITVSSDSVLIYAAEDLPLTFSRVETVRATFTALTDTVVELVKLNLPAGVRGVPSAVKVIIPVEPLIAKTRSIPVEVINVPDDKQVLTFPSEVEISYLIPMSMYNNDDYNVSATADYNKISPLRSVTKIPVELPRLPEVYRSAVQSTDSVEYVVEQK